MGLLTRFRESSAIRSVQASLQEAKPMEEGVAALRRLCEVGTERAVPILREALFQDNVALQVQAARALAAIHERHPSRQILEALNGAALHERQADHARQAAIEALTDCVDVRHAGSLIEAIKSHRTPSAVRSTAVQCLKRLHYPEVLERLVEAAIFPPKHDPHRTTRDWAVQEILALNDRDKLTKLFEIVHGRRILRYRALDHEEGPTFLIRLMCRIDRKGAVRFLHQMVDDDNPVIRATATQCLHALEKQPPA